MVGRDHSQAYIHVYVFWILCTLEADAGPVPLPNEKSLKEKKRKLEETLSRVVTHFVSQFLSSACVSWLILSALFVLMLLRREMTQRKLGTSGV